MLSDLKMSKRKSKEKAFSINLESISSLPVATKPFLKLAEYDNILMQLELKPIGFYHVNISGKKISTVYQALAKRLRNKPNYKLHTRNKQLYIEKLSTET